MSPSDFRLGNLVMRYGKVHALRFGDMIGEFEGCSVIEINEEWLVRLGFEYIERNDKEKGYEIFNKEPSKHIYIRTFCEPNIKGFYSFFNHSECNKSEIQFIKKITHIHQLQNLYYSLTNTELTLK
jgi:hypothetical protein